MNKASKQYSLTVTKFPSSAYRAIKITNNELSMAWPENFNVRSQDLDNTYYDAGQMYWGRTEAFINKVPLFTNQSVPVVLPSNLVHDIDTLEDWNNAELLFEVMHLRNK